MAAISRENFEVQGKSAEAKNLFVKLTEEKNRTALQNEKLRRELEMLRHGSTKSNGVPFLYVVLIGLLGILLGYFMTNS